jgi:hypothetical protein
MFKISKLKYVLIIFSLIWIISIVYLCLFEHENILIINKTNEEKFISIQHRAQIEQLQIKIDKLEKQSLENNIIIEKFKLVFIIL